MLSEFMMFLVSVCVNFIQILHTQLDTLTKNMPVASDKNFLNLLPFGETLSLHDCSGHLFGIHVLQYRFPHNPVKHLRKPEDQ